MTTKKYIGDNIGYIELLSSFGDDLTVVNTARVSFHKESTELKDNDTKLINYLARNNHISPFFHPMIRLRIKMPIFVVRQWFKHTVGFSRNEVSRRYVDERPEFWTTNNIRKRNPNLKQGSSDVNVVDLEEVTTRIKEFDRHALDLYNFLLQKQVCPELARTRLPMCFYTEFIETASLAGYARLYGLRSGKDAQKEIREYADIINEIMLAKYPISWMALTKKESKEITV